MTGILSNRRETAARAFRVTVAVVMVLSLLVSISTVPVAAQNASETNPCEFGPPVPVETSDNRSKIEAGLTLDGSGSLTGTEAQVRSVAKDLVGSLDNTSDEAAVASFSDPTRQLRNLTSDFSAVNSSIDAYNAESGRASNIGEGINATTEQLTVLQNATDGTTKALVLVSDGRPTTTESGHNATQEALDAASAAKGEGITIITVAINDSSLNNPANTELMAEMSSGPEFTYVANSSTEIEGIFDDVEADLQLIGGGLRVNTRDLFKPGATHDYGVINVTYVTDAETGETETIKADVTEDAKVTTTNTTVLSVDEANNTLTAASDPNTSTWVRVDANYQGKSGCTNVIVAEPTVENLELIPGIWHAAAIAGDATLFALLIATLLAVPAARFTSAFGGLAMAQMVVVVAWFAGYINFGIAAASLFVALFIGLNLAANVDYQAGALGRR